MLLYCDSFDHYAQLGVDGNFDTTSPLGRLGWSTQYKKDLVINPGKGRWGTNRLDMAYTNYTKRFSIGRSCNKVIVGFAFQRANSIGSWVNGLPVYNIEGRGERVITFGFGYDTLEHFRVTCTLQTAQGIPNLEDIPLTGLGFTYTTGDGTGYPAIQNSPHISTPFIVDWYRQYSYFSAPRAFTFLEIYIDVTDYKNGTVKVAVNGTTVHTLTGIVTCAYNGFGDNPADARAKINTINFGKATSGGTSYLFLDSMYVCDGEGGYQDDFLGDIFVRPAYPTRDGDRADFSSYVNGVEVADPQHEQIDVESFDPAVEPDYIQGDIDGIQELVYFDYPGVPEESTIIAVNHRTAARSVASVGTPPPNTLVPLFKSTGNDTIITNTLAKKFTGWTYQFLDIYYTLVPGLTVEWTHLLLEESQYGFMLREPIWTGVMLEDITLTDEVTDE